MMTATAAASVVWKRSSCCWYRHRQRRRGFSFFSFDRPPRVSSTGAFRSFSTRPQPEVTVVVPNNNNNNNKRTYAVKPKLRFPKYLVEARARAERFRRIQETETNRSDEVIYTIADALQTIQSDCFKTGVKPWTAFEKGKQNDDGIDDPNNDNLVETPTLKQMKMDQFHVIEAVIVFNRDMTSMTRTIMEGCIDLPHPFHAGANTTTTTTTTHYNDVLVMSTNKDLTDRALALGYAKYKGRVTDQGRRQALLLRDVQNNEIRIPITFNIRRNLPFNVVIITPELADFCTSWQWRFARLLKYLNPQKKIYRPRVLVPSRMQKTICETAQSFLTSAEFYATAKYQAFRFQSDRPVHNCKKMKKYKCNTMHGWMDFGNVHLPRIFDKMFSCFYFFLTRILKILFLFSLQKKL
jgi:hypothetical protein